MLTGRQIVHARRLLRWSLARTAALAGIGIDRLLKAQGRTDEEAVDSVADTSLRRVFETAGIRFITIEGEPSAELAERRRLRLIVARSVPD